MTQSRKPQLPPTPADRATSQAVTLTVPNALCAIRLVGAGALVMLAAAGMTDAFVWLFVFLAMTDWVDGKLAILLDQRSEFGARLDSWADAALYAALLVGSLWLRPDIALTEGVWILLPTLTWAASVLAGWLKFRQWPSYHTRAAKIAWLFITIGAVCVLLEWTHWPLRIGFLFAAWANVESLLITHLLDQPRVDQLSLRKVLAARSRRVS